MSEVPLYPVDRCNRRVPPSFYMSAALTFDGLGIALYRNTSSIRNRLPIGPYSSATPRVLGISGGGGRFLLGEVPLYTEQRLLCTGLRGPRETPNPLRSPEVPRQRATVESCGGAFSHKRGTLCRCLWVARAAQGRSASRSRAKREPS